MNDELVVDSKSVSLWWRVAIGVAAVIIIGLIAFPFVQQELDNSNSAAGATSAEEQFKIGNAHYQAGRWDQAIAAYQKAIALDPQYQAAYANLGVTYYQNRQFDLAASQYEKALELKPDDGEVAYNLGVLYLQQALSQGQPDQELLKQAVTQLQKAQQLSPQLAEPYFSLGVAYMALNQKDKAIDAFEAYLNLDSSQDSQAKQEAARYLEALSGQ